MSRGVHSRASHLGTRRGLPRLWARARVRGASGSRRIGSALLRLVAAVLVVVFSGACGDSADISPETCTRAGGAVASAECPNNTSPLLIRLNDERLCCFRATFNAAQCSALGGGVYADPGDGSLNACPDGKTTVAWMPNYIEGARCCVP